LPDLERFQNQIGVTFNDSSLLEEALTHSSAINEAGSRSKHSNERLEFLGDAVLGLSIAGKLFRDFPGSTEGELTRARSALIRRETLAEVATSLKLGSFLRLGKGEDAGGGRGKAANLAGALEALLAAIYLDQGQEVAQDFILREFATYLPGPEGLSGKLDYKSRLQELVQSQMHETPVYEVVSATGPVHDVQFIIQVKARDTILGSGTGKSKKAAETEAARKALQAMSRQGK
jgi:ribonuclease-3